MNGHESYNVLLMKYPPAWGLPSVSAGCIQVEAYLRLSDAQFSTMDMTTAGPSPTGCLPAVETPKGIAGRSIDRFDDLKAASDVIKFLSRDRGLDSDLPGHVRAESQAFCCLFESHVCKAVRYSTWCEWGSLSQLPDLVGRTLPWPLNYIIPYTQAMAVGRQFSGQDITQMYADAKDTIKAMNDRAEASEGPYILGKKASVLDAKVYGILSFILASPTVAPVLKDELSHSRALRTFLNFMAQSHFAIAAPTLTDFPDTRAWSAAASGAVNREEPAQATPEEKRARSNSGWWLAGAGMLVVGYVLFGGHYFAGIEEDEDEDEELE